MIVVYQISVVFGDNPAEIVAAIILSFIAVISFIFCCKAWIKFENVNLLAYCYLFNKSVKLNQNIYNHIITPGILPCGVLAITDHKFRFPSPSRSEFCFP